MRFAMCVSFFVSSPLATLSYQEAAREEPGSFETGVRSASGSSAPESCELRAAKLSLDDRQDLVLAKDRVLDVLDLDLGAGVLSDQDGVALLDVELHALALVIELALTDGDDLGLLRLLFGRV